MCEPISIAMGTLAVASSAASYVGQSSAAKQQNKVAKANYEKNQRFVDRQRAFEFRRYRSNIRQNALRQAEEMTKSAFEQEDILRLGEKSRSQANVALGEAGVEGNTADLIKGDVYRQQGEAQTMIGRNLEATLRQLQREADAMAPAPVNDPDIPALNPGPSPVAAGLGALSGVMGAAAFYQSSTGNNLFGSRIGSTTAPSVPTPSVKPPTPTSFRRPTVLTPTAANSSLSRPMRVSSGNAGSYGRVSGSSLQGFGLY